MTSGTKECGKIRPGRQRQRSRAEGPERRSDEQRRPRRDGQKKQTTTDGVPPRRFLHFAKSAEASPGTRYQGKSNM